MNNYDFLNLSPTEFELLVRDLIQADRSTTLENFAEGSDDGIDLRYTTKSGELVIVQCKRYKSYGALYKSLEKEVSNVKELNPHYYIIATSVPLTPRRKKNIQALFGNYIKSNSDILGKEDLNNLLSQHERVLLSHYKLYLSSTAVLKKIINAKVYNQTQFEEAEIKNVVKLFVQNESFNEALELIQQHQIVLISGNPGVGKTTLARMLVYYLLSKGFDEFAYLSDSVSEAITSHEPSRKIVYFFDDFLGTNFLDNKMPLNEDNRLLQFISGIKRSPNHVLILTTREYILNQAQQVFEKLNDPDIEISKCLLDVSKYTTVIKAQILANHLYFNHIPYNFIAALMEDDAYMDIVYHANFNPRIIEMIVDKGEWKHYQVTEFPGLLKSAFYKPEKIWLRIYENQISIISRCALAILATFNSTIYLDDFKKALRSFADAKRSYGFRYNIFTIGPCIRELENTFISITKDSEGKLGIDFQNPSIRDFLMNYLSQPENEQLLTDILDSAVALDQLTTNITTTLLEEFGDLPFTVSQEIKISLNTLSFIKNEIVAKYDKLASFRLSQYNVEKVGFNRYYSATDEFSKLAMLLKQVLYTNQLDNYHRFLVGRMQSLLSFSSLSFFERQSFIRLFEKLYPYLTYDEYDLVERFGKDLTYLTDWSTFIRLKAIIPNGVMHFKNNSTLFNERYELAIQNEKANKNRDYLRYTITELQKIGTELEFNVAPEVRSLQALDTSRPSLGILDMSQIIMPDLTDLDLIETYNERVKIKKIFNGILHNTD